MLFILLGSLLLATGVEWGIYLLGLGTGLCNFLTVVSLFTILFGSITSKKEIKKRLTTNDSFIFFAFSITVSLSLLVAHGDKDLLVYTFLSFASYSIIKTFIVRRYA
jgi:hypothetical protein